MAKEINDRREEGDLKENGGYHAAREEQGKQEGRILQLQAAAAHRQGRRGAGQRRRRRPRAWSSTVRFDGDDDDETFLIGSREEAETAGVEVYSAASPLGRALTGAREGDTVEYETPTGKTMKVTLVTPGRSPADAPASPRSSVQAGATSGSTRCEHRVRQRDHRRRPDDLRELRHPVQHMLQVGVASAPRAGTACRPGR